MSDAKGTPPTSRPSSGALARHAGHRRGAAPAAAPGRAGTHAALAAMVAAWAALFSWLSVARHHAFATGRFDLGNMVQAVWSTLEGRPLETTNASGEQFSRLGAHVDPILAAFAPLYALWPAPEALLVAQAVLVALGAVPAFWLGRRWLGDDRLALAAAGVYLLYPPLGWATVTEFHPVTLAAPLLMLCVWALEAEQPLVLLVAAPLAALTKEQVGLALAGLGIWALVRGRRARRRTQARSGAALVIGGIAWTATAVLVVIPRFATAGESAFIERYSAFGDDTGEVARTLLTRPWEGLAVMDDPARWGYLAALLLPLLALPLLAPLLAAAALPELALNLLPDWWPQHSIEFQYVAVIVPCLVAATILGLARAGRYAPRGLGAHRMAGLVLVALAVAGVLTGPLPVPAALSIASENRLAQYRGGEHARALAEAVARIPPHVAVSAGNVPGSHLSARRRILTFPVVAEAEWVVVDRRNPHLADRLAPAGHARALSRLRAGGGFVTVFARDGVLVLRRR